MTSNLDSSCRGLVSELMSMYGQWEGASQLQGTATRLSRMYEDFCWTPEEIEKELASQFRVFDNGYDEMLVTGPIVVWALCPHHLLPAEFRCWIGYVPDGRVLGLSKFARVATVMGKRPVMQEQYTMELARVLVERLKPKGVGVYVVGRHGCMVSRGIRQDAPVVTSSLDGCILQEPASRAEFYSIVNRLRRRE